MTGVATAITAFVGRAARGPTERPVTVSSFGDFERQFGGLWQGSQLGFAVRDFFANGGTTAIIVRLYRAEDGGGAMPATASLTADTLTLQAAEEGAWGNALRARVDHDTRPPDASRGEDASSLFNLSVRDGTTGTIEEHRNVVVAPADHPRLVTKVLEDESRLVRATAVGGSRPAETGGTVDPGRSLWDDNAAATNVSVAIEDRASDGQVLDDGAFTAGGVSGKRGLFALERADQFNLLVVPPHRADGTVGTGVVKAAAEYCEDRRAVLLVDAPPTWDETSDVEGDFATGFDTVLGTASRNAALYFPRLRQPNPLKSGQVETFAAGGAVAGILARTDAQRGVWRAPAGLDAILKGVPALSVALGDVDIGRLNPLGVNCLRAVPGVGQVVWGARTMAGADQLADEWKYLPVRRTALFIEESVSRGTQWAVFEPNDEPLWAQLRLHIGTFMNDLFRQGAFHGATPREAYFVTCDRGTTTQADIDRGVVTIHVGFAAIRPAEFVVIRLQQMAGQPAP
jgi:hypothetical protein